MSSAERAGSGDAAIRALRGNDLAALAATLPRLRAVAFNGAKAAAIGRGALAGTSVALLTLPSSSPLHTVGIAAKQPAWDAVGALLRD